MKSLLPLRGLNTSFDWAEILSRLEASRQATDSLTESDQKNEDQILRQRAVALAKGNPQARHADSTEACIEVLVFVAGGERYAFETAHVARIYPKLPLTTIPGVPNFVTGIVAAHGGVLSVIDLRSFLDLPLSGLAESNSIIVLKGKTMEFGVHAEAIVGVMRYTEKALEHGVSTLGDIERVYLKGITQDRTAILDAERLLSDPRMIVETD